MFGRQSPLACRRGGRSSRDGAHRPPRDGELQELGRQADDRPVWRLHGDHRPQWRGQVEPDGRACHAQLSGTSRGGCAAPPRARVCARNAVPSPLLLPFPQAICFVLGLGARSLRGESLKDLIHARKAAGGAPAKTASVSLVYVADEGEVDGEAAGGELVFSRRISASGASTYSVDGVDCAAPKYKAVRAAAAASRRRARVAAHHAAPHCFALSPPSSAGAGAHQHFHRGAQLPRLPGRRRVGGEQDHQGDAAVL